MDLNGPSVRPSVSSSPSSSSPSSSNTIKYFLSPDLTEKDLEEH